MFSKFKDDAANAAMETALKAIQRARQLCEEAGYGSLVIGPLFDAESETKYALDTALGRI